MHVYFTPVIVTSTKCIWEEAARGFDPETMLIPPTLLGSYMHPLHLSITQVIHAYVYQALQKVKKNQDLNIQRKDFESPVAQWKSSLEANLASDSFPKILP